MGTPGFQPTGAFSAALTIALWVKNHDGKHPTTLDCKPSNGLLSFMTYYRRLPGSSFSAIISAALAMVSAMPTSTTSLRMRHCLGPNCEASFPYEGSHIALCPRCRKHRAHAEDTPYETPWVTVHQLQRFGFSCLDDGDLIGG